MIYLLIAAWIWLNELISLNQISRNNQARQEAQLAYQSGKYQRALTFYTYLTQHTSTIDAAVRLNLGHTYFNLKQYTQAKSQYEALLQTDRHDLRTAAATQLGVLACLEKDSALALTLFRQALLENADNESARYNFELIKRYYSGQPPHKRPTHKSSTPTPQQVNKPRPMGGQQVERSTRQDEILRRFRRLNLSEEQALQLLDAMRGDDLPYALTRSARQNSPKPQEGESRW
ncbi:tetratricopeptide repeat protein [Spirosoma panaciterrae]|uniref:tetratricopeptide repeat protein n=1 Tax=Spirosoma panaciterrae TaxID=496058 RepID=UPI00037CD787|nr:tetratricopeptide repeat protein [Spirosoma panaciterrae]